MRKSDKIEIDYQCVNGAYHEYACCPECWNTHPKATLGKMFMGSQAWMLLRRQEFIKWAEKAGFTHEQAVFLAIEVKNL